MNLMRAETEHLPPLPLRAERHAWDEEGKLRHVISIDQFSRELLDELFEQAALMKRRIAEDDVRLLFEQYKKILITLFYEPSTRTRCSFESAALRLGMDKISTENAKEFSSGAKGETLEDTLRVVSAYGHMIALRHHQTGELAKAVHTAKVPVINAGDGKGEHPTQTLLDLFTLQEHFGTIDGLTLTMMGDLARGRTVHSLARAMRFYKDITLYLVAGKRSQMPDSLLQELDMYGIHYIKMTNLTLAMRKADANYDTRTQRERYAWWQYMQYRRDKRRNEIHEEHINVMPPKSIILHPLPQVGELATFVHNPTYPQLRCFEQSDNGVPMRMALIDYVMRMGTRREKLGEVVREYRRST